jgi:hypothetical protein
MSALLLLLHPPRTLLPPLQWLALPPRLVLLLLLLLPSPLPRPLSKTCNVQHPASLLLRPL